MRSLHHWSPMRLVLGLALLGVSSLVAGLNGSAWPETAQAQQRVAVPDPLGATGLADYDYNWERGAPPARTVSAEQREALEAFRSAHPNARARWHDFSGSLALTYGFASGGSAAGPEAAARDFIAGQAALFGTSGAPELELVEDKSRAALGGHLLRFQQTFGGVPIIDAGVGVLLDESNRVRAVSGPVYADVAVATSPSITAAEAVRRAGTDLAALAFEYPVDVSELFATAFEQIEAQLGPFTTPDPQLAIYPTADDYRLAWRFYQYSRNPFGVFRYVVDAHTGEVLSRESMARTALAGAAQDTIEEFTADVFPSSPPITRALQDRGAILDANGEEVGRPLGQMRVTLRKFDASNAVTGAYDELTGTHAAIQSALPTRQPFAQAARGTFHFHRDSLPLVGRTNEVDHLAEPAEHQDAISQFFYITSLLEYLDHLHVEGDRQHNPGFGEGDFPNTYPSSDQPLSGTVHLPNVLPDACGDPTEADDAEGLTQRLLACDNALAFTLSETVHPTFYGHGYYFNNLAIDAAVTRHEGTHATITPIAGFEGFPHPEAGALNEGQADLWAYTISDDPTLGAYIVNAFRYRDLLRANGVDPDTRRWIRHADSQLRYSQLGTDENAYEVHQDGEIYAGAMWDIRQMMMQYRTGGSFVRPNAITGAPTDAISLGKETWERLFLGSMYVLGTMAPDYFIGARDAMLIADQVLYSSDPTNLDAPGMHWALIERMFAARELGQHANPPANANARQTISTAVSAFAAAQGDALGVPQGVLAEPVESQAVRVSWQPVDGAIAYQVLKRRRGTARERLFPGIPFDGYYDGDAQFSGYTHLEYVYGGSSTSYVDAGQAMARHGALGLESVNYDYVVRAVGIDPDTRQVGFSDLSATATVATKHKNVGKNIETQISNVRFDGAVFTFDQALRNIGGSGDSGGTIFEPITFKILNISEQSVTVANADNGGTGQNGDQADFVYQETLPEGATTRARTLKFNNPEARLFRFHAKVTGFKRADAEPANGSQDPVDTSAAADTAGQHTPPDLTHVEEFSGIVPIGTTALDVVEDVDYVDVPFTARASATGVMGELFAPEGAEGIPDLELTLFDSAGRVLASSTNPGSVEVVSAAVQGGENYVYRVSGWANAPTEFRIVSTQEVTNPEDANRELSSEPTSSSMETLLLEFTVDPVTGAVSLNLIE